MELKIHTLKGSCILSVDPHETGTVRDLQTLLHEQHQDDPLCVPQPEQQRLVYKQAVLPANAAIKQVGLSDGDQLVLLAPRKLLQPPAPQIMPVPDAAAIRAAITDEARQRGLEHTLREERPPALPQRRNLVLPPELLGPVDGELLQLLEQALAGAGGNILQGLRLSGSGDGSQGQQEQAEEEEEEEADIQPPEPSAGNMAQLADMGFSEALARKALQLTRDNVELALDWLLQHSEEPGAAEPPTQEQLRAVYGRRRRRAAGAAGGAGAAAAAAAAGAPSAAVLAQLTDMGFEAAAAQQALARVGPNLDLAVTLLLGQGLSAAMASARGSSDDNAEGQPAAAAGTAEAEAGAAQQHEAGEMAELLDDEEEEEYEDAAEDEYVSEYEDTDADADDNAGPALPLQLEQALGTMGSMDLRELGSSDMEQLLQGVAIQDLVGNQLLMSGGIEGGMGGMAGPQGALLRLMEAPGLLQQMFAGLQDPEAAAGQQQAEHQPSQERPQQQQISPEDRQEAEAGLQQQQGVEETDPDEGSRVPGDC